MKHFEVFFFAFLATTIIYGIVFKTFRRFTHGGALSALVCLWFEKTIQVISGELINSKWRSTTTCSSDPEELILFEIAATAG